MRIEQLTNAALRGLKSLPNDLYLGLRRTVQDLNFSGSNKQIRRQHFNEDHRFTLAITNLIENRQVLSNMGKIIINDLLDKAPEATVKRVYDVLITGGVKFASRSMMQVAITTAIGSSILIKTGTGILTKIIVRGAVGITFGGITLQGCIARSSAASRRLRQENPSLWIKLHYHNYDMLYFLFEEPVKKLNETINNPSISREAMSGIEIN